MNKKERALAAIRRKPVDRIPCSYRGLKYVSEKLLQHFGFEEYTIFSTHYVDFLKKLGADFWAMGHNLSYFSMFHPMYTGPMPEPPYVPDGILFHALGIRAKLATVEKYNYQYAAFMDPPLAHIESAEELRPGFLLNKLKFFDFSRPVNLLYSQKEKAVTAESNEIDYSCEELKNNHEFIAIGSFNSIFIICSYLRGMDQFLMDMFVNEPLAERLTSEVGEFMLEFSRRELEAFRGTVEFYSSWDDVAGQEQLFFPPEKFEKYFLPWYRKLIDQVHGDNLIFNWHCCGTIHDVLPMMIDGGIDMYDVAQTSARDMDLETLYRLYHDRVCIHGGLDVQRLMINGTPEDIRNEVKKIVDLWGADGGIIISPAHEVEPETPLENVLAIYEALEEFSG